MFNKKVLTTANVFAEFTSKLDLIKQQQDEKAKEYASIEDTARLDKLSAIEESAIAFRASNNLRNILTGAKDAV